MADDLVPVDTGESFFDKINLPRLIAGPAGEAISKLVGSAADIPAAWLQQVAQGVRDKTEARTAVSKAIAEAAASNVCADPELVRRAANSFVSKELRRQIAKETIAQKTIEILDEEAKSIPGDKPAPPEHKVDDDWLNVFARYAEDATSERLQELWARVLAGQIRKPNTFSVRTLRFIAELDAYCASLFEKYAARVVLEDIIPFPPREGSEFSDLIRLEEIGLINFSTGALHRKFDVKPGPIVFPYKKGALLVINTQEQKITITGAFLTRVGHEVLQIVRVNNVDMRDVRHFAGKFPKTGIGQIVWLEGPHEIPLWQAPPKKAPPTTSASG